MKKLSNIEKYNLRQKWLTQKERDLLREIR